MPWGMRCVANLRYTLTAAVAAVLATYWKGALLAEKHAYIQLLLHTNSAFTTEQQHSYRHNRHACQTTM
jgi:hypothetical protein